MPQLPTLTVSAVQADRLMAVFGSPEAYKSWLMKNLKARVMEVELESAKADAKAYLDTRRASLETEMNGIT